jgi:hypothetical protein
MATLGRKVESVEQLELAVYSDARRLATAALSAFRSKYPTEFWLLTPEFCVIDKLFLILRFTSQTNFPRSLNAVSARFS